MCLMFDTDNLNFSSAFDIIPVFSLTIMTLCKCSTFVKVLELPVFQPNDHLFEKHADKGTERW